MEGIKKRPLVSICTLVYNHEPFLKECFEGFLMQKTNFAFEVLVHDDASTDNSAEIIREYTEKYPDIFKPIYQIENQYSKGVKVSATYQFPRAKGKYIAICEGDDYWTDPLKLQKQVDILEQNPDIGLVYTQAEAFDNENIIGEISFEVKDAEHLLLYGNGIANLTTCYRRELLYAYLKEVDPGSKNWLMGDYPMWLWFMLHSKAYFLNEVTCRYRILQNSASHSTNIHKVVAFEESVLDIRAFFINKYWNKDRKLLKHVYTKSTWYIFRLYIVNNLDKLAFKFLFQHFKMLKHKQQRLGLTYFVLPFIRNRKRAKWTCNTRIFK